MPTINPLAQATKNSSNIFNLRRKLENEPVENSNLAVLHIGKFTSPAAREGGWGPRGAGRAGRPQRHDMIPVVAEKKIISSEK